MRRTNPTRVALARRQAAIRVLSALSPEFDRALASDDRRAILAIQSTLRGTPAGIALVRNGFTEFNA